MALLPWYGAQRIRLRVGPFLHHSDTEHGSSLRVFSYMLHQKEVTTV